ncbi:MAG: T9SS type A sorting domain-containing protein [Bacteroidetes bacterium]|nr:T9SS type A sorting domain-containing protein [Bacteroidota bacterium]
MKKSLLFSVLIVFCYSLKAQMPIDPKFYGQNFWFTDYRNAPASAGTDLLNWTEVQQSGAKFIRVGGHNYNFDLTPTDMTAPTNLLGYVNIVDAIRSKGGEPMITVGLNIAAMGTISSSEITTGATQAAEIVRILNIANKRNVKYYIIANEPGKDFGLYTYDDADSDGNPDDPATSSDAITIANYVKAFSTAMKNIDPEIKVIAPELEFKNYDLITPFMTSGGSADLTGLITTGKGTNKNFVDFFSYHSYPGYYPVITNRNEYIDQGYAERSAFSVTGKPTAMGLVVDEYNLKSSGNSLFNTTSFQNVFADPNSFLGGQMIVDMMAGMINADVDISNMWSTNESLSYGFIHDAGSGVYNRKPSYWHYWMMANYFKGDFFTAISYKNISGVSTAITTSDVQALKGVKAYACNAGNYKAVLVTNEHTAAANITLSFNSTEGTTAGAVNFAIGSFGGTSSGYPTSIPGESTYIIFFNCSGAYTGRIELKRGDMSSELGSFDLISTSSTHRFGTIPSPLIATPNSVTTCVGANTTDATLNLSGTANWYVLPNQNPIPDGTDLQPGVYQVDIAGTCGTSSTIFSIHERAPIIDAGNDQTFCPAGSTTFNLGVNATLPTISPGYSWTKSNSACSLPTTSGNYITGASCSTSSQYVLTADDGVCPVTDETYVYISNATGGDPYIRDWVDDIGSEPNAETNSSIGVFWESPDIWFRQYNDGHTNQVKEGVEYAPGINNYVYMRVKNRGCAASTGQLHAYWAKASTGLSWQSPNMWDNYNTTYSGCTATLYGDEITSSSGISFNIPAGGEQIFEIPWTPANPNDFNCFGTSDKHHFCLLGRVETSVAMTEGPSIVDNTKNNNNIAWTNIWIDNSLAPFKPVRPFGGTIIRNIVKDTRYIKLNFVSLKDEKGQSLTDNTRVRLHFTQDFLKRWAEGGKRGKDIVMINETTVELTSANATMEHIFLPSDQVGGVSLTLQSFKDPLLSNEKNFTFQIIQYSEGAKSPQGGQSFYLKKQFYGEKCATTAKSTFSGVVIGTKNITGTVQITGNVTVPAGATLVIQKATVYVDANVKIKVLPGGVIKIIDSEFFSTCTDKKWNGIEVKGNPLLSSPLIMSGTFITGTDNPLTIDKAKGIQISNSSFIGDGLGIAVSLDKMKDFEIYNSTFDGYNIGINTSKTIVADVKSIIEKNVFNHVRTAVNFSDDNHIKLDIKCNNFEYTDYAILSDQTILKDQGFVGEGAGNEFNTASTLPNNKLKHTNGNNAKYYYDPSKPIINGMNVTTLSSTLDRACFAYTFDTSAAGSSARLMAINNSESINDPLRSINKKLMDLNSVPNPNSGVASIYYNLGEEKQGELVVMDMFGKIIDRIKLNSETTKIDVNYTNYANGVYMLSLINAKGEAVNKKMIITR